VVARDCAGVHKSNKKVSVEMEVELVQPTLCPFSIVPLLNPFHRRYHGLTHLQQMFGEMDRHVGRLARPDLVALAIFFHEYVYLEFLRAAGVLDHWFRYLTLLFFPLSRTPYSLIYEPRSSTNEEDSAERFHLFAQRATRLVRFLKE